MNTPDQQPTVDLSIIVAVYKSEQTLPELVRRIRESLDAAELSWELIFVDDASPTDTWSYLAHLASNDPQVSAARLVKNGGQQRALLCGIDLARGRYVVTMDDDLQHSPEDIPRLLQHLQETDADAVIARFPQRRQSAFRRIASATKSRFTSLFTRSPEGLTHTSFRVIRGQIAHAITEINHPQPIVGFLLCELTTNIRNLDVVHVAREHGGSTHSVAALVIYFAYILLTYSDITLQLVSLIGLSAFGLSVILGVIYFLLWLVGQVTEPGFTTIILLLSFYSGLILLSLGVLGIFLKRILNTVSMIPPHLIRDLVR